MTTQAPTFTQPLQSVVVLEGSTATFEAQVSGSPVPEVSWFRDGQVISTSTLPGVQISFSDGRARLMIPAVTKANSGRYSLRATNGSGQATSTAELLVTAETAPPNFSQRLQSMTVRQGSQVRLQVRVTGIPTPVVKFYRDGAEIQSSLDFQISQEGDLYSLLIAEAYPEDSGTYSVNATNSVGRATSTAELVVQGEEVVPAKKTKTIVSTAQISETRQTRIEKKIEAHFDARSIATVEMVIDGATGQLPHKTPPRIPPKPKSRSPTPPSIARNVSRNLSELEREDSTANEHFHTPTDERSSPYETWRSDSFGTPNEAIEPKDNEMPPSFIEPLSRRKIYENTTLGFIIEVEGLPVPGVKWYRNKSLLEPDDRIKMERVGNVCSLEIANIQKGDGGEYLCHAVNIIGEAKSFAIVDVIPQEERAVALPPPVTHQHIMEFDVANSNSSRTPSPQEIVLEVELSEKDVKEFEKQVKIVTVPEFTPDHKSMIVSLDILPLSLVDPSAESQGQEGREFKIDLEAFEMPPRFITPICDFRIPENSSAVFKCSVIGIPPPEVRWYKEYMCIEPDDTKYVISEEKGSHSLRIQDVGPSDCATYRCRALNSAGEAICRGFLTMGDSQVSAVATRTSKVTLSSQKEELVLRSRYADSFFEFQVVDGPPRFIKGISDCHAPLGTAAYFQCLVRGSPRPTVSWYKDGKLVQGSRFSAEESGIGFHNLFITGLVKGDEGEYSCVATNNSGMARSSAILTLS